MEDVKNIRKILENLRVAIIGEDHGSTFHKEIETMIIRKYKSRKILIEGLTRKKMNKEDIERPLEIMNFRCGIIKRIEEIYTLNNIFEIIFQDVQNIFKEEVYKNIILKLRNDIKEFISKFFKDKEDEKNIWKISILNLSNNYLNEFIK